MFGGFAKYLLQLQLNVDAAQRIFEAGVTALICGVLGKLGAEAVVFIKRKIKK